LSSTTVNELIQIIAEAVMSNIVQKLSRSKYYSISVDSTHDLSHNDHLAVTIRYVLDGVPTERFLTLLPIKSHKAAELVKYLLDFLESQGIDIMNCRGQTYDNASNMAGKYSGMQASGESRIIFLPERSSIWQYPCKISAINVKKQSRTRLLLTHPVLYILKIQKTYGTF